MEYIIATGHNPQELEVKIQELAARGYTPVGGIVFSPARLDPKNQDKFLQIMGRDNKTGGKPRSTACKNPADSKSRCRININFPLRINS